MNGNDLIEFEEKNKESLISFFIEKKYQTEWNEFVLEEYNNKEAQDG